jgi:hypothetical protein
MSRATARPMTGSDMMRALSQSSAGADIEGHESEENGAERQIGEIEHRWSPERNCVGDMPTRCIKGLFGFPPRA